MRRQGVSPAFRYSALAALVAATMAILPAAQAFQADPTTPTDRIPLLAAKHKSKARPQAMARNVAQLSSAPLALTVTHAALRDDKAGRQSVLDIRLAPDSRQALAQLTGNNVGRSVALRADGELLATVVIRGPIEGGAMTLTPGMGEHGLTEAKLEQIARKLSSGQRKLEVSLLPRA